MQAAGILVEVLLSALISALAATFSRAALVWAACLCVVAIVLLNGGWTWLRNKDAVFSTVVSGQGASRGPLI